MMAYTNSGLQNSLPSMTDWLSKRIDEADIPEWMTKGKTTLIQKGPKMEPPPNY